MRATLSDAIEARAREAGAVPTMSAAAKVLDRLERVKATGPGRWIAACPAHEDHSPSLSVRETDDGRVLIHDFGGCPAGDVLAAVGLTLADLFDRPVEHYAAPTHSRVPARDVLVCASFEITVAVLLLADVLKDRRISEPSFERLAQAAARIGSARDHIAPADLRRNRAG